jgi:alpha-glucosidase
LLSADSPRVLLTPAFLSIVPMALPTVLSSVSWIRRVRDGACWVALMLGIVLAGGAAPPLWAQPNGTPSFEARVQGPGPVRVTLSIRGGTPHYAVHRGSTAVVAPSPLGLSFRDVPSLDGPFEVAGTARQAVDTTWTLMGGGPAHRIRNRYRELTVRLRETTPPRRRLTLVVRVYADGMGLRYVLPAQEALGRFAVTDEHTTFRFARSTSTQAGGGGASDSAATAWWIPGDPDSYEYLYRETPLAALDSVVATPMTMRLGDSLYASVHEAALTNYPGMRLAPRTPPRAASGTRASPETASFEADLVPLPETGGIKARLEAPFATPWRTLTVGPRPGALVESHLTLNLNPPCRICDGAPAWLQPGPYVGIWWEIHKGRSTWAPGPNVGATTANAKRYIDFAAAHDVPYLLVEGWNVGWDNANGWSDMDFTTPQSQYDLREVADYGRERGVRLVAHMETGANVTGMEAQLDSAFALYDRLGIWAVKTGYVGTIEGHHHHDQRMVNHYRRVVQTAAEYGLMINAHEPIKPTGVMRTYPNMITREGVRGMEYNAWSAGNPPRHTVTLPFTRMLAGPLDYTPGIVNLTWQPERVGDSPFHGQKQRRVHGTRARQLALPIILMSGLQMMADVPANYRDAPAATRFLADVPAAWDETRVISGAIGEHIAIARRDGTSWYVGAATNDTARTIRVPLRFLAGETGSAPTSYTATVFSDSAATDAETAPHVMRTATRTVRPGDTLTLELVGGGGAAVRLQPQRD